MTTVHPMQALYPSNFSALQTNSSAVVDRNPGSIAHAVKVDAPILVLFDRRVADLEVLYNALSPNAIGYIIEPEQDALVVITQLLASTEATQLAIVAHGEPGVVHLGAKPLNLKELQGRSCLLQEWNVEEIALYSCEVGQDDRFIAELERSTGAQVSAAIGKVGAAELGGSWVLQVRPSEQSTNIPFRRDTLAHYSRVLANVNTTSGNDTFDGTGDPNGNTNTSPSNDTINVIASGFLNPGDIFNGGVGNDTINIIGGNGTYSFTGVTIASVENLSAGNSNQSVTLTAAQFAGFSAINLGNNNDTITISVTGTFDFSAGTIPTITNVETINIIGSTLADSITLTGAQLDSILSAADSRSINLSSGTDTLNLTSTSTALNNLMNPGLVNVEAISAAGAASGVTINLSNQAEGFTITGSSSDDAITGGGGNDIINSGAGNDTINGFTAGDQVNGGDDTDTIALTSNLSSATNAQITNVEAISASGAASGVTINLGSQSEGFTVTGSGFSDTITGGTGNDTVAGGAGNDTINSGTGNDTVAGGVGDDTIDGGTGNDTVTLSGNRADYTITFNNSSYTVVDNRSGFPDGTDTITNVENFQFADATFTTATLDITAPAVSSVAYGSNDGTLKEGETVTLTLTFNEAVTVNTANGSPTLSLNSGGTATLASGSGTNQLVFTYTVGAGQTAADLAVTAFNLNNATIRDAQGNAAVLTGAVTNPTETLVVDTTAPAAGTLSLSNFTDTGLSATDSISSDNSFDLTLGGNEPGSTVVYQVFNGSQWVTTNAAQSDLADGDYQFRAQVADAAGNLSTSNIVNVRIDTTAPGSPALSLAIDSGSSDNDGITNSGGINVAGLEEGSTRAYSTDGGQTWTDFTGDSFTLTGDGTKSVVVRQVDAAGNFSISQPLSFTLDTATPGAVGFNSTNIAENNEANAVIATLSATDSNAVTYALVDGEGSTDNSAFTISGDRILINGSANFETKSSYSVRIRATDAAGNFTETTQTISVTDVNEAPTAITLTANPIAENAAGAVVGTVTVADPDTLNAAFRNNTLTVSDDRFEIVAGQLKLKAGQSIDYESLTNGQLTVTVTATDANNSALTVSQAFTLNVTNVNEAPALTGTPASLANGTEDTAYTFTAAQLLQGFTDADGNSLSVANVQINGVTLTPDAQGNYVFTPPANANGSFTVNYSVSDGTTSTPAAIDFTLAAVNDAPGLTGAKAILAGGTEDNPYIISAADLLQGYSDVEGNPLAVDNLSATNGTIASNNNGTWTFTPGANYNGSVTLTYNVIDGNGGSTAATQSFSLAAVNDAPTVVNAIADQSIAEDSPLSFQVPATAFADVDGDTLTYTATLADGNALPSWLSFDPTTRTFSGTPLNENVGTISVRVTATDGSSSPVSDTFDLTVNNINDVPTAISLSAAIVDEKVLGAVIGSLTVTDPDLGDTHSFTISDDRFEVVDGQLKLKSGESLDYATLSNGQLTITVTAKDVGGLTLAQDFTINVNDRTAPTVTVTDNVQGTANRNTGTIAYTYTFNEAVTGLTADDFTIANGTISSVTGSGTTWTVNVAPAADVASGNISLTLGNNAVIDAAGNPNVSVVNDAQAIDTAAPTVAITSSQSSFKAGETATVTFTFSEAPTDFDNSDISVTGGTLGAVTATDNPLVYTATFTPTANTNSLTGSISVAGDRFTDVAGNNNAASTTNVSISGDTLTPTVSISSDKTQLKAGETATITFTFSEAPTGFSADDITVSGGILAGLAPSQSDPLVYTATFTPTAGTNSLTGTVQVTGEYADAIGNAGANSNSITISGDTLAPIAPTLSLSVDSGTLNTDGITNSGVVNVAGLEEGSIREYSTNNGESWTTFEDNSFTLSGDGEKSVIVRQTDAAGNSSVSAPLSFTLDTTAPGAIGFSVTSISENNAAGAIVATLTSDGAVSYELVDGTGTDNSAFTIVDNALQIKDSANFEAKESYSVRIRATDAAGNAIETTQIISINDVNEAPTNITLNGDSVAENAAGEVIGTLTVTDPDTATAFRNNVLTVSDPRFEVVDNSGTLQLKLKAGESIDYESLTNGQLTVTVTATDANNSALTASQAFTLNVTNVNEAPALTGTPASLANGTEDTAYTFTAAQLLQGFTDADGNSLSVANVQINGVTLTPDAQGNYVFNPPANANGSFTVNYSVSDGTTSTPAAIGFTLAAVNDVPVLTGAKVTLGAGEEDKTYIISAADLLQGYSDVEGNPLAVDNLSATNGTIISNNDGTWTFTPDSNFNGTVDLTYNVVDGNSGSIAATQSFSIASVNDPVTGSPTATLADGTEDTAYTVTAAELLQGFSDVDSATNGQTLSIANLMASNGTVTNNDDGTYTITPAANFNGNVTLTYDVTDGNGSTLIGQTRSYSIASINDAPVIANPIAAQNGTEDTLVSFTIPANTFSDVDGGDLTLSATLGENSLPNWLSFDSSTGTFSGTPPQDFNGTLSLTVTATDAGGLKASSTFDLVIAPQSDAAIIGDPSLSSVTEDMAITDGNLTATGILSISDPDQGQAGFKTTVISAQGNLGSLSLAADGSYTYSVANSAVQSLGAEVTKVEQFTVEAIDGTTKQISFTINGTNDAPVLTGTKATLTTGNEDTAYVISADDLLAGFTDVDSGDTLAVSGLTATNGMITANTNGSYTFTPNPNFNGTIDLSYSVIDGKGGSVSASQSFSLNPVNDAPEGGVTISGEATEDATLTASNSLADADGLGTISYQWQVNSGTAEAPVWTGIAGATSGTFTPGDAQVGKQVRVVASYTDPQGTPESVASAPTAAIANINDAPIGAVTLSGTATQGETLTVADTLADADGLGTISYQWNRGGQAIDGATGTNYTLTQADVGAAITVTAFYRDGFGEAESVTSAPTAPVANVDDPATGTLGISGTAAEGATINADISGITDADGSFTTTYQWQSSSDGNTWTNIAGATSASLSIPDDQSLVSQQVRVQATTTDSSGGTTNFTSAAQIVANVEDEATGTVTVSGIVEEGATISATTSIADSDGSFTTAYQWQSSSDGGTTWADIASATLADFAIPGDQSLVGQQIRVRATTTDGFNGTTEFTSAAQTVANVEDEATGTLNVTGSASEGGSLTASLTDVVDPDGAITSTTYQWQEQVDGSWVAIAGATEATLTIPGDESYVGKQVRVVATTTDSLGGTTDFTSSGQTIANVNDAPTAIGLSNTVNSIAENTSDVKVADITITDDALGTNTLTLSGTDAANFAIRDIAGGKALFFIGSGNFESGKTSYSVTVAASDSTVTGSTPVTQTFTLDITNVNEAPTAAVFANTTTTIAENTAIGTGIKVADINVTDDALGTNTLSLTGEDADSFAIRGTELYYVGSSPNFEAKASYSVNVVVNDTTLGTGAEFTLPFSLSVTDVDEVPPTITLSSPKTSFKAGETTTITFTFSEAPTGFTAEDISVTGGALTNLTVDPTDPLVYTATFTPTVNTNSLNGAISIAAGSFTDAAGNPNLVSNELSMSGDTLAPNAPTIAPIEGDNAINAAEAADGAVLSGTAEAGATVNLNIGGLNRSVTASNEGWSYTLTNSEIAGLGEGAKTITVTAVDAAGNTSQTTSNTLTIDTVAPTAGTLSLNNFNDTGASTTDRITNDRTFDLTLTSNEPGSAVKYERSTDNGTTWTDTIAAQTNLTDGSYQFRAVVTDAAGNTSTTDAVSVTVDGTAPTTPTVSPIGGADSTVSTIAGDAIVTGTAEAGSTVMLNSGGNALGTAQANSSGVWSYSLTAENITAIGQGTNKTITAEVTDLAGNTATSVPQTFAVDTLTPDAPIITNVTDNVGTVSSVANGTRTNDPTPTFAISLAGTNAVAGNTVRLFDNNATQIASVTLTSTQVSAGTVSIIPAALAQGSYSITATITDAAGNQSAASAPRTFILDTTTPTPTIAPVAGDNRVNSTERTTGVTVSGTAEANSSVKVNWGGTIQDVTADDSGNWSSSFSTSQIPASGTTTMTVTATDAAGNSSTATRSVIVDANVPNAPIITNVTDNVGTVSSVANGTGTNDPTPTFAISLAETNAATGNIVRLFNNNSSTPIASVTLTSAQVSAGTVSITPAALPQGNNSITATITDAAGNQSNPSTPRTFTIDTAAPIAPTIDPVTTDNIVNQSERNAGITVSGTAEANSTVRVTWGANTLTTTANTEGIWSSNFTAAQIPTSGTTTISATATDAVGNTSPAGNRSVRIDTTPPATPTIANVSVDNRVNNTEKTNGVTVSGTAEANSTVRVTWGNVTQEVAANSTGGWSRTFSTDEIPGDGNSTISVTATDSAGNTSTAGTRSILVDTIANAPTAALATDSGRLNNDQITNRGVVNVGIETGATWQYSVNSGTWVNGRGTSFTLTGDGVKNVSVRQTDAARNNSNTSSLTFTLDTTAPGAPSTGGYTATSINGTAEANADILLSTSATAPTTFAAQTTATGSSYSLDIASLTGSTTGTTYYLYSRDAAGNISAATANRRVIVGTGGVDTFTGVGSTGSDLIVGGSGADTASYAVASSAISLTGQLASTQNISAGGTVNINTANIDVLTGVEQLQFTNAGYTSTTANIVPGTNQLRSPFQSVLTNNSAAAFAGNYDSQTGTFTFGSATPNATLIAYDSNAGSATNYEAFLLLGKTSMTGATLEASGGTVRLNNL